MNLWIAKRETGQVDTYFSDKTIHKEIFRWATREEYSIANGKHQRSEQEESYLEEKIQERWWARKCEIMLEEQGVIKTTTCLFDECCRHLVINLSYG